MEASNGQKAKAGQSTMSTLDKLLDQMISDNSDVTLQHHVAYGAEGKDQKQFKADAQINFVKEHLAWLLECSTSVRSDRVKGKEFDIEHIKKILAQNGIATKAYFVVPDSAKAKEVKSLDSFRQHIQKQDRVTYFDDALSIQAFRTLLENKLTENQQQGQRSNTLGTSAEELLCEAFNNEKNIVLWNNPNDYITKSDTFGIFSSVLHKLAPTIGKIRTSVAYRSGSNDEISKQLTRIVDENGKSRGMPKTDVYINVTAENGDTNVFKVSVKKPSSVTKKKVTVHEGSVEQLLSDLKDSISSDSKFNDPNLFDKLSVALIDFQNCGSKKGMKPENVTFLNENLADLNHWLIDYCVFGINNPLQNKEVQQANALLSFNPQNGDCTVRTVAEEEQVLIDGITNRSAFGTPFSWTYPSKKRGKKIQLKCTVN